ncbi:hypothetical protein ACW9HQ_51620, partial [Nocardia gipuzkoensis]
LAQYADPSLTETLDDGRGATPAQVRAARHALSCGRIGDLVAAVTQPMSPSRFWRNLTGAPSRTTLRIPQDPFVAERRFCG